MSLSKLIQFIRSLMAKKAAARVREPEAESIRLKLIAVDRTEKEQPRDDEEVQKLVAQIILLGTKKGRPARNGWEAKDAA